ncbi:hypothetical protein DMH04_17965 [Kibdelosporangium aridum]|uniref:Sigma 54 modulation/S30EA ribosomal protein C-terminal domain-containing protein n=1 Tax=Kibdelosporangium aridum TaxID=2030 RepID=A0A428ZAT0_KIBAR|nr:sigma 54 modulation/S30EA ribosomal C-terminal domain-containing protein [Kibdelosporangium aridum]RSM85187.1 hypothetical protein DMH04_17965 [Kibdelosporangium aridum]
MRHVEPTRTPHIVVSIRGRFGHGAAEYARAKVDGALSLAAEPVLSAKVRLARHTDPSMAQPVIAQANVDVNGRLVRVSVAGHAVREAVDLLDAKLRHRLRRIARHWEARRGGQPKHLAHEWRHNNEPSHRPAYFPRPTDEREIIRRKSVALDPATIDEAAFDMDTMDYEFYLFIELGSRLDSVVYRAGPTGYRVAQAGPADPDQFSPYALTITVSTAHVPVLSTTEAVERLDITGLPFLFYIDNEHLRGSVLYRRYDGHYGLISPGDTSTVRRKT